MDLYKVFHGFCVLASVLLIMLLTGCVHYHGPHATKVKAVGGPHHAGIVVVHKAPLKAHKCVHKGVHWVCRR